MPTPATQPSSDGNGRQQTLGLLQLGAAPCYIVRCEMPSTRKCGSNLVVSEKSIQILLVHLRLLQRPPKPKRAPGQESTRLAVGFVMRNGRENATLRVDCRTRGLDLCSIWPHRLRERERGR